VEEDDSTSFQMKNVVWGRNVGGGGGAAVSVTRSHSGFRTGNLLCFGVSRPQPGLNKVEVVAAAKQENSEMRSPLDRHERSENPFKSERLYGAVLLRKCCLLQ
jgi:hypothetical protein